MSRWDVASQVARLACNEVATLAGAMPALVAATFYIGVAMAVTWRISEYEEGAEAGPGSDRGTPLHPPTTSHSLYAYPGVLRGGCVAKQRPESRPWRSEHQTTRDKGRLVLRTAGR